MTQNRKKVSRRDFFKTAGVLGLGTAASQIASKGALLDTDAQAAGTPKTVTRRPFGRTGATVSILSLGGMFDIPRNQLMLRQAIKWGVTYWDTANSYGGGRSEEGIGKYFNRFPEDRKRIFLVTKSGAWTTKGMTRHLNLSLRRMQTDFIDLFFVHAISSIDTMDKDIRAWAEKAKSSGKIRLFGFSTHSNMEACLANAPKLGWIDGIMITYNFRLMHTDDMRRAVDACLNAGIGLTAMKVQGGGSVRTSTQTEMDLAGKFLKKGFTEGQAKLMAVWQNKEIASICSQMPNMSLLMSNIQAAMKSKTLSASEVNQLERYASETRSSYCAGCTDICESVVSEPIPVGDIMRYLMYSRTYDNPGQGRTAFRRLPVGVRRSIARADFSEAEKRCPRQMAITKLMRQASRELA